MKNKTILVIDDEIKIVEVIKAYLENQGYEVYAAHDGKNALQLFDKINPVLLILDLMLPDISGEEVCKIVRKQSRVPIIMLTAKAEEKSILNGFDLGADDYVSKPFSPRQLMARINAVLRRTVGEPVPLTNNISYNKGDLIIDNSKREVRKAGREVSLTASEYKILMAFINYPKKIFTREELLCTALGQDYDGYDRVIDTHIKNLRHKLEDYPRDPSYIVTVHGMGYKFGGETYEK